MSHNGSSFRCGCYNLKPEVIALLRAGNPRGDYGLADVLLKMRPESLHYKKKRKRMELEENSMT